MDAIFQLGILPFIGLCAGTGALAYFITRAVTPAKPCTMKQVDEEFDIWSSQKGHFTHFKPGQRRLVHVSRGAIGANMKDQKNFWPTGIVIDEHGKKHEFHEVYVHTPGKLVFDLKGETANVYLVTHGQITGRHLEGLPTYFIEPIQMLETPTAALKAEIETLRHKLREAEEMILERDSRLELLRVTRDQTSKQTALDGKQVRSIIEQLRDDNVALHEKLKKEVAAQTLLPLSKNINLENQCRVEQRSREIKIGSGCGAYYETEYYDKTVALKPGDEGYIDKKKQVRYARVRNRTVKEEIVAVPLQPGDLGYVEPKKPVFC